MGDCPSNKRSNGWCFTINNWTEAEWTKVINYKCEYGIFGKEIAPTTGTKHIQGYWYFNSQKQGSTLMRAFPRASLRVAKGTPEQNRAYCSEDGDFVEVGTMPVNSQGHRSDLEKLMNMAIRGEPIQAIINENPTVYSMYGNQIRMARRDSIKPREMAPTFTTFEMGDIMPPPSKTFWFREGGSWDGYYQQAFVVLFVKRDNPWIKKVCDKYPLTVPVKYGHEQFNSKRVIIMYDE